MLREIKLEVKHMKQGRSRYWNTLDSTILLTSKFLIIYFTTTTTTAATKTVDSIRIIRSTGLKDKIKLYKRKGFFSNQFVY